MNKKVLSKSMISMINNVQNQSNKKVVIAGTLFLIAASIGMMISMPQMIGIANAQSQQGLEGFVTQVVGVPQCQPVSGAARVFDLGDVCNASSPSGSDSAIHQAACAKVGGTFSFDPMHEQDICTDIPKVCTTGDLVDNQCMVTTTTRLGVGNQP
jgi:hypothetical protein